MLNGIKKFFQDIQNKSEAERKRYARFTAWILFLLVVFVFIMSGAGIGTSPSREISIQVATNTPQITAEERPANPLEAIFNFFNSAREGYQNLRESVSDIRIGQETAPDAFEATSGPTSSTEAFPEANETPTQ